MAVRFYLMPEAGDGTAPDAINGWHPKYRDELPEPRWWMHYGREGIFVTAADVTATQHSTLSGHGDVTAVPLNLDANPTAGAVAQIQSLFESFNIPSGWVSTSLTYRQILKGLVGIVRLYQRFDGYLGRLFGSGITLDTNVSDIPAGPRSKMAAAAQSLGCDTTGMSTMTVRQALRSLAIQLGSVTVLGETL